MSNQKENKLVQWLDQLQEQSWNLELIISGFVLFGLFQLRDFLDISAYYIGANDDSSISYLFGLSLGVLQVSVDIFIFSLLILVFTRGLWIGALGLRYVSGNIDFDSFSYSDRLKQYLKRKVGSFDDYIQRLEHVSSSVFAFTYLLFFMSMSLVLFDLEFKLLDFLLSKLGIDILQTIVLILFLIAACIVFFDFVTLGLLKSIKQPFFAKIYLPLYRFVGIATLSFLWRPIWYNFIDQRSTKWIAIFSAPLLMGFIIVKSARFPRFEYQFFPKVGYRTESGRFSSVFFKENARNAFQAEFYDDLRLMERQEKNYELIDVLSLPSHRINVTTMEVFVKYTEFTDEFITQKDSSIAAISEIGFNSLNNINVMLIPIVKKTASEYERQYDERQAVFEQQYDSLSLIDAGQAERLSLSFKAEEQLRYRKYLERVKSIIKQSFSFEINEQPIPDSTVYLDFHIHPNFEEKGFICTFPIQHAHAGTNRLTLKRKFYSEEMKDYYEQDFTIPFIYTGVVE
ncbi:MAG: hypothetical protein AAF806_03150 [Bacteroidota bacterium]